MTERRKDKRYTPAYPLEVDTQQKDWTLDLIDVSKGGLAILSNKGVSSKDRLPLKVFFKSKMISIEALPVYVKKTEEGNYKIGVLFSSTPEGFEELLEKEMSAITNIHRKKNLYDKKSISFKEASQKYLHNLSSEE